MPSKPISSAPSTTQQPSQAIPAAASRDSKACQTALRTSSRKTTSGPSTTPQPSSFVAPSSPVPKPLPDLNSNAFPGSILSPKPSNTSRTSTPCPEKLASQILSGQASSPPSKLYTSSFGTEHWSGCREQSPTGSGTSRRR